jgi:hypothetical protein
VSATFSELLWAAILTGAAPGLIALVTYAHQSGQSRRDRRRELYSGAFRAVMGWVEGYYRVRRRAAGDERQVVEHLHDLWEQVAFYESWLATEAPELGWSYHQLVLQVKRSVSPLITEAWAAEPQPMAEELPAGEPRPDRLPDVMRARDQYLADIRSHQSPWPWRRRRLRRRYRAAGGADRPSLGGHSDGDRRVPADLGPGRRP